MEHKGNEEWNIEDLDLEISLGLEKIANSLSKKDVIKETDDKKYSSEEPSLLQRIVCKHREYIMGAATYLTAVAADVYLSYNVVTSNPSGIEKELNLVAKECMVKYGAGPGLALANISEAMLVLSIAYVINKIANKNIHKHSNFGNNILYFFAGLHTCAAIYMGLSK